ncbi:MAG: preprotein translocase subunit SecG [Patescibacteria group bacterium]
MTIATLLPYVQITLGVLLIGAILLQRSEASLGSAFGVDSFGGARFSRRGAEKFLFIATIVIALLFVASTFFALIIR